MSATVLDMSMSLDGFITAPDDGPGRGLGVDGEVLHGDKRGRAFGYPTANMAVQGLHLPRMGVYAVMVDVLTGPERGSSVAVGTLPHAQRMESIRLYGTEVVPRVRQLLGVEPVAQRTGV